MTDTQNSNSEPWWKAFPEPRSKCPEISAEDMMKMFDDMDIKPELRSFLLVDVRRDDWEGGAIKTSLNMPAQSFHQTRKTLLDLCDRAGVEKVIFYCGSSSGRGPRCAGWMQDYIDDIAKFGRRSRIQVFVLKGGIKGWVKDFKGSLVDGFEEEYWKQFK